MKRLAPIALVAVLLVPATARADGAETVKLSKLLQLAVRQNPNMASASIDVATADARVLEESGIDDWQLDASGTMFVARLGGAISAVSARAQDVVELSANLKKALRSGGMLTLGVTGRYNKSTYDLISGAANVGYSGSFDITFDQPLLRGHGEKFARAKIALARIARTASERSRHGTAISVARDVIIAYWELAYAQRDLQIRKSSLELAKERLRITRAGINAGAIAPVEALAVEQVIAQREEEILTAQLAVTKRSLDLRQLVNLPIDPAHLDLDAAAPVSANPKAFDLKQLLSHAYDRSPEITALKAQRKGALLDVEVTRNGLLPQLDLSMSFGPAGVATNARNALSQAGRLDGFTIGVSLKYQQSLGRTAARGALRASYAGLMKARLNLTNAKLLIAGTLALAVKTADVAAKRIKISQRAIKLAEQNIKAEKARFDLGRATNFDIMQRQEELKAAQLRFARANIDYIIAVTGIDAATGDLLPRYGIVMHYK